MLQGLKNVYHLVVAMVATIFFRFPARKLFVIGVTGTDGKTTTVNLLYEILKTAGKKVAMISSVGAKIGEKNYDLPFHVTTPSSWQLQRFIRLAVDRGEKYLVLEVTSHGLDQKRVFGCNFKMGVLTNVTHEHLDYHQTVENYLKAKAKLFREIEWAILNREDRSYRNWKLEIGNWKFTKILTYGLRDGDVTPSKFPFATSLPGEYNQLNCLAAIAATKALGIPEAKIRQAVAGFGGVVGRFELVETGRDFRVMIDFAHTPNALEQVLSTVRRQVSGRLIHVFGSAGLRDASKRPLMGEAAAKYDDVIILTEEDYRTEDVNDIIREIENGVLRISKPKFLNPKQIPNLKSQTPKLFKIIDRQEAIDFAIKIAQKGDLVILTGKGHEKSLCRGRKEYPWGEHEAVRWALRALKEK